MPRTYHSLGFDLCHQMRWCRNLCTRGKHTQSFSDGIQLCSVALSQPIWLHLPSSWSHTRTLYLAVFIFIGQPWFMTIKVQNNWLTLDVFYKSCSGGKALASKYVGKWVKTEGMHDVMQRRSSSLCSTASTCVFLQQAPPWPAMYVGAKYLCIHKWPGHVTFRWETSLLW